MKNSGRRNNFFTYKGDTADIANLVKFDGSEKIYENIFRYPLVIIRCIWYNLEKRRMKNKKIK